MKNYKHILEAIRRGINLALDDYEETSNNDFVLPQKDVIKNNNSVKGLIAFWDQFVDLGLPSGTLWCKYNLGVDPKNLKEPIDYYGKFFAWGELTEKDWYNWLNYNWAYNNKLTKYCNAAPYGYNEFVDNLQNLKLEDDIVTKTFGKGFHIPTSMQVEELLKHTNYKMVKDFGIKGLHGVLCQSKVNDNYIFIPMAGWKTDIDKSKKKCKWFDMGQHCEIWASDYYDCGSPIYANVLSANIQFINKPQNDDRIGVYQTLRCWGLPIRPVKN